MMVDLRKKYVDGDSYHISVQGNFSCFDCIYRFDGINWERLVYSGDLIIYRDFKKLLDPKQFKEVIKHVQDKHITYSFWKR